MSSPIITPDASAAEQSRKNLQDKLNGLGGLNGRHLDPEAKAKKLREACEGFESIFIQKMWQEMRNTVPKGGMLQGREERFWQDMYDQELSKSMTRAGGIGLADMMYEQLSRNLVSATQTTVGQYQTSAFAPSAAPLVPETNQDSLLPEENPAPAVPLASIYEGEAPETGLVAEARPLPQAAPVEKQEAKAPRPEQQIPAQAPAAPAHEPVKAEKPERKARTRRVEKGDSPLDLAYLARREAGDKLGSRAVRPALQPKKSKHAEEPVQEQPMAQAAQPGSIEALRAAMETAKSGAAQPEAPAPRSMAELVAQTKLRNEQAAVQAAAPLAAQADDTEELAPTVRKVRTSTNIPRSQRSRKNARDAIRMLNVDNVSVNSKAGKGLAAYHAAQEEALKPASLQADSRPDAAQAAAEIKPLTAPGGNDSDFGLSFAVPPLKPAGV